MSPKYAKGKVTTTQIEHAITKLALLRQDACIVSDEEDDLTYALDVLGRLHTERLADLRREGKDTK